MKAFFDDSVLLRNESARILFEKVKDSFILGEVMGSDHCPVGIELDI